MNDAVLRAVEQARDLAVLDAQALTERLPWAESELQVAQSRVDAITQELAAKQQEIAEYEEVLGDE
ncbi:MULTISPECIES: hypothetical protein [unclassified Microbacterium]|uniref:hypothetical protein n=1 Tax=unclassified Microbacterium TaxID=2609290 RepID=UPI00214C33F5|nr:MULTISPECIES: hypothetical protein [unclassified Microbacterium]MCR2785429.1 hypothetical protein [Microbacterium sp. zg.B96]WIM14544.1 hypothetical protein QNO11_08115 [Microbacterium sp. zg-B96]